MDAPRGRAPALGGVGTRGPKAENLALTLIVDRGIVTTPPMVFWPQLSQEMKAPAQTAVMMVRQKGAFHVTGATVDDPKLQTKLQTIQEGQQYQISLTYAGGWEPGLVKKTLTVTTDDPKQPTIKVPLQAMVQAD